MTKQVSRIDQAKRKKLCERIRKDDGTAVAELARLYRESGYNVFANALESTEFSWAKDHAEAVLSAFEG